MKYRGYAGTVLYIDLTNHSVRKEALDIEMARSFIGGMGINSKLAWDLIKPGIDPLSPENVLVFGAGPFVGTLIPGFPRSDAISKSPLTGFMGQSGSGNSIGAMLRYAGYDHLVITGQAEKPVYLVINDDEILLKDGAHLWGMDALDTTDRIQSTLGDHWISTIGPAGENLVRFASIIENKFSMLGRTGLGAIMGSKNLKAIAVRGTKGIEVYRRRELRKQILELRERIAQNPLVDLWRNEGKIIDGYVGAWSKRGLYLTKNFAQGFPENATSLFTQREYAKRIWKTYAACLGCVVGCKGVNTIKGGEYAGLTLKISNPSGTPPTFNICGIRSWEDGVKCHELCNRYGIDAFTAGVLMAFAIELFERGIISKKDTGGMELNWNADTALKLIHKVAHRDGIGDVLAEGIGRFSKRIGRNSEKYAVEVKGLEMTMDLRESLFTENFGQLLDPRGGHHARSYGITYIPRKSDSIKRYASRIGVPENAIARICPNPNYFSMPRLSKWVQDYNSLTFSLGACMRPQIAANYDLDIVTKLFWLMTGIDLSRSELLKAGERIWNIQRLFNAREGASRKDDLPPARMTTESVKVGDTVIPPLEESYVEGLLDEYFEERGWDIVTGNPTSQKLEELMLDNVKNRGQDLVSTK
jgi:aldehyde:ferredoxin oxidoreductase